MKHRDNEEGIIKGAAEGIPPDKTAPVILFIILSIHGICGL